MIGLCHGFGYIGQSHACGHHDLFLGVRFTGSRGRLAAYKANTFLFLREHIAIGLSPWRLKGSRGWFAGQVGCASQIRKDNTIRFLVRGCSVVSVRP